MLHEMSAGAIEDETQPLSEYGVTTAPHVPGTTKAGHTIDSHLPFIGWRRPSPRRPQQSGAFWHILVHTPAFFHR